MPFISKVRPHTISGECRIGKWGVAWSASREQANVNKAETQYISDTCRSNEVGASREVRVSCFDNVKLVKAGEYLVRGVIGNFSHDEGVFEPMNCFSVQGAHDALVIATSLVRQDERNLIPIRLLTLKDNVHLKKGAVIGTLRGLEASGKFSVNMRSISLGKKRKMEDFRTKICESIILYD